MYVKISLLIMLALQCVGFPNAYYCAQAIAVRSRHLPMGFPFINFTCGKYKVHGVQFHITGSHYNLVLFDE